jgi:diguanylate cyclase (GGDEF)-like protein
VTFLLGALVMVPLCRQWIGGPIHFYIVAACGLSVLVFVQVRQALFASMTPREADPIAWFYDLLQAAGYVTLLVGFLLWVRSIRISKTELDHMAATDALTQLSSRRQALVLLRHEMARAKRYASSLSVVMVDVDRLKPVNDLLGHLAGDALLVHVAQTLKRRLRATDTAARYGGDEFLLVLPEANAKQAAKTAEDLCHTLAQNPASYGNATIPVQASFGVAELTPGEDTSLENLIARADKAVYAVKRTGGNGVAEWSVMETVAAPTSTPAAATSL